MDELALYILQLSLSELVFAVLLLTHGTSDLRDSHSDASE